MSEPAAITFEKGYQRLQEIAEEVNQTEVPVDRMADLFAEAKGLDTALSGHLESQKARIEKIERGEGIQAFTIVPPDQASVRSRGADDVPTDTGEFAPAAPAASGTADDDIPF